MRRALVSQEQWQAAVNEALGPLAAGETEAALTGLAASCGDILAAHFPPGAPWIRRSNGSTSFERQGHLTQTSLGLIFAHWLLSEPQLNAVVA